MASQPTKLALAKIRTDGGTQPKKLLSPEAWFADVTYVSDPEWKDRIERECMEQNAIAFIDLHPEHGYVFHTLMLHGGDFRKKECANWFVTVRVAGEAMTTGIRIDVTRPMDDRLDTWAEESGRSKREHVAHIVREVTACYERDPLILHWIGLLKAGRARVVVS